MYYYYHQIVVVAYYCPRGNIADKYHLNVIQPAEVEGAERYWHTKRDDYGSNISSIFCVLDSSFINLILKYRQNNNQKIHCFLYSNNLQSVLIYKTISIQNEVGKHWEERKRK